MMTIRYMIKILMSTTLLALLFSCHSNEKYKDTSLAFKIRVDDLVSRMTLEEKVSQLTYNSVAVERLGIPEYNWWNESLHGVARSGIATVFPQAIGMAAMWDDRTMFSIADAVSDEARAKYHAYAKEGKRGIYQGLTYWTPNINIFRDPRWGRGMETYGEDPYLTGKLGVAYIKGLQGNDDKYFKLIATAKHFAVHSGPESTRHSFNATPERYDFLETYSPQFKMAIDEADVYSVMCAYNSYMGQPCCGNIELSNLLRNDWDFKGYIVSDCWAVKDFYAEDTHEIVKTKAEAAAIALRAGTDLNCGDSYPALVEAVKEGYITEKEIDISLKRLLLAKMKLGIFDADSQVPFSRIPYGVVDSKEHQEMALEAAQKSIVLLENKNNILPFSKKIKNVAVIGPNANEVDVLLGNYNGYPSNPVTPYQGIKNKLPRATVNYAPGCQLAEGLPLFTTLPNRVLFTDKTKATNGLTAEYFNNNSFEGKPQICRVDENVDFNWWDLSPDKTLDADTFSVRWTGVIVPEITGKYAIGVESFPQMKLWINNQSIATFKSEHQSLKKYDFIEFEAGESYEIKLEFIEEKTEYAKVKLLWEEPNNHLNEDAINIAKGADLVVLCMGLSPMLEGEEMKVKVDGFSHGDREDIKLPAVQTDLIKRIHKLGKPTVLVLLNGSALAFNWEAKNIPAILEAWYPGQAGGTAIADIIFGDCSPSGRLPLTFYKSIDQLPEFDDYNMEGKTYRYFSGEPLYEFGYGLSYTKFKYSELIIPEKIHVGEDLSVSVKVTNTGDVSGDEVVQLYVSHPDYPYKKAIRTLKGFKRISLKSGESKYVDFILSSKDIAVLNPDNKYILKSGHVAISVGGKQPGQVEINKGLVISDTVLVELAGEDSYIIE